MLCVIQGFLPIRKPENLLLQRKIHTVSTLALLLLSLGGVVAPSVGSASTSTIIFPHYLQQLVRLHILIIQGRDGKRYTSTSTAIYYILLPLTLLPLPIQLLQLLLPLLRKSLQNVLLAGSLEKLGPVP